MDFTPLQTVCLSAIAIAFVYLFFYFLFFRFAHAELKKINASWEENAILLYVEAEALEYYLRMALAASGNKRQDIIVNIPRTDSRKDEMKAIVCAMRRKHKNIFYRMI
ncbi:MAG: hypothetical protein E7603_03645 [Ruminococcaceae bacterium]|nr:hypothetical protein [Oscillospiraceae bacterium]